MVYSWLLILSTIMVVVGSFLLYKKKINNLNATIVFGISLILTIIFILTNLTFLTEALLIVERAVGCESEGAHFWIPGIFLLTSASAAAFLLFKYKG